MKSKFKQEITKFRYKLSILVAVPQVTRFFDCLFYCFGIANFAYRKIADDQMKYSQMPVSTGEVSLDVMEQLFSGNIVSYFERRNVWNDDSEKRCNIGHSARLQTDMLKVLLCCVHLSSDFI